MADFKPEDFSPIHYYPEVPDKEGWYVSTWAALPVLHTGKIRIRTGKDSLDFWYWTGHKWAAGINANPAFSQQDRNWFGLKENPFK